MGGAQNFTSISFRLDNVGAAGTYTYTGVHVWMRNTTVTDFTSQPNYPGNVGFTEVYNGNFTFNGTGIKTFNFNVAPSFAYNGTDNLEVLFEFQGGDDNTWYEPWFDRTNARTDGVRPGKVGQGFNWTNARANSSLRQFNLQINNTMGCSAYPLGVTFTGSNIVCNDSKVLFEWNVSSEENNDYFTIDSSLDGIYWTTEKNIRGAGTTANPIDYSVELDVETNEMVYYRLSQTDFDGTKTFLVTHAAECRSEKVNVSPNPFGDFIGVYSEREIISLNLTNTLGESIPVTKSDLTDHLYLNTELLKKGVYVLTVTTINDSSVHRIVKN